MPSRPVAIPRLLHVGPDCLFSVAPLLVKHGFDVTKICVGSGDGPSNAFAQHVATGLRAGGMNVVQIGGLKGSLDQSAQIAARIIGNQVSLVIGVGGGRVIDTVKLAAARTGIDFVSIPTTLAHDGISSPVASLIGNNGARASHPAIMPAGVIVDLSVISAAPQCTIRSGVGDLVSNLTAILDWRLADRRKRDRYDAFSAMIAESAARPILAVREIDRVESHEILATGLLLSGLAMAAANSSRPCSGAEHLISHSLDALLGPRAATHGEQVALGCLVSAAAHESPLLSEFQSFFAGIGLPIHPADLAISDEQMLAAILAAPATRPERHTILSDLCDEEGGVALLMERAFAPCRDSAQILA